MTFPEHVGRCDHQNSCGYHFTPKMYFAENPLVDVPSAVRPKIVATPKVVLPTVMEPALMAKTMTAYHLNPLFRFLSGVMGEDEVRRIFQLYNVGTSRQWGGAAVFWQVDHKGQIRAGKVCGYNPFTGHRIKKPKDLLIWAHWLLGIKMNLRQCLFGEHLLRDNPAQQVVIVESEKTALICAWKMPEYVWLATGGKDMLKPSQALLGRDVILIPDLRAEEIWRAKMPALKAVCRSVTISDYISKIATDEERKDGLDIADFLLMDPTVGVAVEQMKAGNPYLAEFMVDLKLTATSTQEGSPDGLKILPGKSDSASENKQIINPEES